MDMITLYLKLAFGKPGCPVCRKRQALEARMERRYIFYGTRRQALVDYQHRSEKSPDGKSCG